MSQYSMPARRTWSDDHLRRAVAESRSVSEVIAKLGLTVAGGTFVHVQRHVERLGLSVDHFMGQGWAKGQQGRAQETKLPWKAILVFNRKGRKEAPTVLRRALIESGVEEVCEQCGQGSTWNGKPLRLPVDHRNGNALDNRPENVRFLCPNCHSQTPTYCAKNIGWKERHSVGMAERYTRPI